MTSLPDNTAAIEIVGKTARRSLSRATWQDRAPILIKVAAAGVNGPDVRQREGHYPAPKGHSDSSAMCKPSNHRSAARLSEPG
jgi:NADPH:quinone reductase